MNIAQAMKVKNRIVGEMNQLHTFVTKHNVSFRKAPALGASDENITSKREEVLEALNKYEELFRKLVEVKTAIQKASSPIAGKLVEIAETKSLLSKLAEIPVKEEVELSHSYGKEPFEIKYSSVFTEKEQMQKNSVLQERVNSLQDEIDTFNAVTTASL